MKIIKYKCDICGFEIDGQVEHFPVDNVELDTHPACKEKLLKMVTQFRRAAEQVEEPKKAVEIKTEVKAPEPDQLIATVEKVIETAKTKKESAKETETTPKKKEEKEVKTRSIPAEKFYYWFNKGLTVQETADKLGVAYNTAYYYFQKYRKEN